eukprot:GHVS01019439.1.p1 GENE.GHVS01019439.1~~GHVS01019439.1.p1  ORF type:complete len:710 (+),score=148.13 GHVS01019439.1:237-2366(+)
MTACRHNANNNSLVFWRPPLVGRVPSCSFSGLVVVGVWGAEEEEPKKEMLPGGDGGSPQAKPPVEGEKIEEEEEQPQAAPPVEGEKKGAKEVQAVDYEEDVTGEERVDDMGGDELFEGGFELKDEAKYAMLTEGFEYKYGEKGKPKNWRKAASLFQKAAQTDDAIAAQAYHELGDMYLYGGQGIRRDLHVAVQHFNSSAALGFGPGLHLMSFVYATGLNGIVEPNDHTSSRLEYLASMTNHLPSILAMGFRYLHGQGVEKDCELALQHYKFAAEVALRHDDGVPRAPLQDVDRISAGTLELWRQTQAAQAQKHDIMNYWEYKAKGGDPMAKYELAKLSEEEQHQSPPKAAGGRKTDGSKTESLYEEAAASNLPAAMRELGVMYLQGRGGVERNATRSVEYFTKGAGLGDAECQNFLGTLFYFGYGVSPDYMEVERNRTKAMGYFRQAAQQDFPESLFFLGEVHIHAIDGSVDQSNLSYEDYRYALRHYERAADHGYLQGYWREAQLYEAGTGTRRSCLAAAYAYKTVAEAGPWVDDVRRGFAAFLKGDDAGALLQYGLAAEEGYEVAQSNAGWLSTRKSLWRDSGRNGLRNFHKSYLQGNGEALYEVGVMKQKGRGDGALEDLRNSALMGDIRSLIPLAREYERIGQWAKAERCYLYYIDQRAAEVDRSSAAPAGSTLAGLWRFLDVVGVRARLATAAVRKRFFSRKTA